jgi:GT2 family glycosyltransferase
MEEVYFLYYEELDWCERAKKAGYLLYVAGESVVYHKESVSVVKTPLRMFYITRNRCGLCSEILQVCPSLFI